MVTLGQDVNHNVLTLVPPCYASLILLRIVGYLIKYILIISHGLVTLIFQIKISTISGNLVVARLTSEASSVITMIVLTSVVTIILDHGIVLMTTIIVRI
jgi:hypothetical protein